jgi:hypothetical protein
MKWNVNNIYEFVLFLTNKNQSGSISAKDFFYAWNSEQSAYHQDLLGRWQNRNNGKSGVNTGMIQNDTVISMLSPFIIQSSITVTTGRATKPDDFIFDVALRINGHNVTKINHGQIAEVNQSVLDAPSITNNAYYAAQYEGYYYILPITATPLVLDYVASCEDIVWGYSYDADGRQVYNSGTSVQPKWDTNTLREITKRTLKQFGVSFKDGDMAAYGNSVIQTGD